MPVLQAVERLSSSVSPEEHGRFVSFLRSRHVDRPSGASMPLQRRLYRTHRVVRPVEYAAQGILGLHPEVHSVRRLAAEAEQEFGEACDRFALLIWAQQALGEDDAIPAALGDLLETWLIERPTPESKRVVESVVATLLARVEEYGLHRLTPPAVSTSAFLVLSHELLGTPEAFVLERCVEAFRAFTAEVTGHLPASVLVVGALLWRALDVGVLTEAKMRPLIEDFPELLRVLESHLLLGTTRVTAAVPPGSRTERFLEKLCLERLEAMTAAPHFHTVNGTFKNVPLWPGREVIMLALRRLDELRELSTDERVESVGSSLWHVLRHTRLRSGETLPQEELATLSDWTLATAAVIAPWLASQVEAVRNWQGLDELVTWCHAHARTFEDGQPLYDEVPRIENQIRRALGNRGIHSHAERWTGVIERDWFLRAWNQLAETPRQAVWEAFPYVRAEPTYVTEIVRALLGESDAEVGAAAQKGEPRAVRLLGVLPLPGSAAQREQVVRARFELLRKHWQQHTPAASRLIANKPTKGREHAHVGVTNLAHNVGVSEPMRLAWSLGDSCFETTRLELPVVVHERYLVEATLDENGVPTLQVIKLYPNERPLKTVPREVSESEEYRSARLGLSELRPAYDELCRLLDRKMILGTPLAHDILVRLMHHPVGALVIPNLVFFDEKSNQEGIPELDEETGELILRGLHSEALAVASGNGLVLAHPLHLEARRTLKAWRETLIRKRITQPFAQLFRIFERAKVSSRARKIGAVAGRPVAMASLAAELHRLGWEMDLGIAPRRPFAEQDVAVSWPLQHVAEPEAMFVSGDGATGEMRFATLSTQQSVSVRDVPDEVIGEALRDASLAVTTSESAPACSCHAVREARTAVVEHLAQMFVERIKPRVPVKASVAEGVLRISFARDGESEELHLRLDIDRARASINGKDVDLPLPSLRRPPYTPHPLQPPLRDTVRLMAQIFQAIDHKREDFRAAVLAAHGS